MSSRPVPMKTGCANLTRGNRKYCALLASWVIPAVLVGGIAVLVGTQIAVEIAGRQKILVNPGRVVLIENVTGKGHITRSVGTEDLTLLIVPLGDH